MSKLEFKIKLDDAKEAERWKEFYKVRIWQQPLKLQNKEYRHSRHK